MNKIFPLITALLLSSSTTWAQNPYEVSFGDYTVNYNAFPSESLEPAIARAVGITRSSYRGVVTIAVRKRAGDGNESAVDAEVSGHVRNLIGQRPTLDFMPIREGESLYYISDFAIPRSGNEQLTFNIAVRPAGEVSSQQIEFSRSY